MRVVVTDDLETALDIRRIVFMDEQGISLEEEVDGLDADAIQLLAFDGESAVGTARILINGESGKIGRVAVLKDARGKGFGKALIEAAVAEIRRRGCTLAELGARSDAAGFYEPRGFKAVGPEFMDAGYPHQKMVLSL